MSPKPWKIINSRCDRSFRIFKLRSDRALSPRTGQEHDFYVLESLPWVNIIPLTTDGQVVLIRQYRHGIREVTLEIPGGLVEPGETPLQAAVREMEEETGYQASCVISLGWVHPNPAIQNNRCYSFLARGASLSGEQQQDEKEDIQVELQPLKEIPKLMRQGAITHSLVQAAFYRLFLYHPNESGHLPLQHLR